MTVVLAIWKVVRPILTFGITLPLWLFLAAGVWLYVDKASAVRTAVNGAVTDLVAGAQLERFQTLLDEERRLRIWTEGAAAERQRLADENLAARADLAVKLALTTDEKKGLEDDLAAIQSRPCTGDCFVDQLLFDRLRNK